MTQDTRTRPITHKMRVFAREFLIDHNATQATIRAGYASKGSSARVQGTRLLANVSVLAEIDRLEAESTLKATVTREYVIAGLQDLAETAEPDSARIRAHELLGKTLRMFVDVTEGPGTAGEVPQLRSYTLEELRELRAVMVDGAKAGQVVIEAPVQDVTDVESTEVDEDPLAPAW